MKPRVRQSTSLQPLGDRRLSRTTKRTRRRRTRHRRARSRARSEHPPAGTPTRPQETTYPDPSRHRSGARDAADQESEDSHAARSTDRSYLSRLRGLVSDPSRSQTRRGPPVFVKAHHRASPRSDEPPVRAATGLHATESCLCYCARFGSLVSLTTCWRAARDAEGDAADSAGAYRAGVQVLPGTYLALFTIVRSRGGLGIPHMRGSRVFRDQRAVGRRGYAYPLIQSG